MDANNEPRRTTTDERPEAIANNGTGALPETNDTRWGFWDYAKVTGVTVTLVGGGILIGRYICPKLPTPAVITTTAEAVAALVG